MLQGIRVLDLARLLPGAYCCSLLADLGADVVRISEPVRNQPMAGGVLADLYLRPFRRGPSAIAIDLKSSEGREGFFELIKGADVLVEGFRPGRLDRLGVGWDALHARNPRIVYCAITGYGSQGSLHRRAGHDLNYLARSGVLALMPRPLGLPAIPGVQIADMAGGMMAAIQIEAGLLERQSTGEGRRIDVSMTDVVKGWTLPAVAAAQNGLEVDLVGGWPCYHVYRTADGFLTVGALEPIFWANFCDALDRPDLKRRQADPTAVEEVQRLLLKKDTEQWLAVFKDRDVCVEPMAEADSSLD